MNDQFIERVRYWNQQFQYPPDIHNDPLFWLKHAHQQLDEAEVAYACNDKQHMADELADTVLVCWKGISIFVDKEPAIVIRNRIDSGLNEKDIDETVSKYVQWWDMIKYE